MQRGMCTTRVALQVISVHIDRSKFICEPLCFRCRRRTLPPALYSWLLPGDISNVSCTSSMGPDERYEQCVKKEHLCCS